MIIAIGCDTFSPDVNGAARFAERLAAGLVERGHEIHVIAPAQKWRKFAPRTEIVEGQPMTVYRLPSWRWLPHDWLRFVLPWRARKHVRDALDLIQPDVIHIQSHIIIGRALAKEATARNIRLVATNHVMPENVLDFTLLPPWAKKLFVRWGWHDADSVLKQASAITTPTKRAADFLERNTSRRGVMAVSCGLKASDYTANIGMPERNAFVYVGRITLEKEIDVILHALTRLDDSFGATLTIVGDGDQRKHIEKLTHTLGLQDRVRFTGHVTDEQLRATLTGAKAFVIASIAELQSIATMEAMASGLPVIAANAMALPHLVKHKKNGYLFQPGNDRELANRMKRLMQLPEAEYVAMQQASLQAVKSHDLDNTLDTFEVLYSGSQVTR